ncbi:DUF559 domain-containing protein [Amycolatopsis anabasis]|uniref:DUF559 domain-containing protein n=1 Tax=Amycolatopsis anabasis TaxID=1840409 RepID=UPI001FE5F2BC|nr:DUF559 domain-containing protein [Amycolatopsis anabasis]
MKSLPEGLHGAYSRADLVLTIGANALRAVVRHGRLESFGRGVLIDPRRSGEFRTRAAAGLLLAGPHAALTGHSALALHGCSAAETAPIHILLPYDRRIRSRPELTVHYGEFAERDVLKLAGLRVVRPDFALAEVLCRGARRAGLACADQLLGLLPERARPEFRARTEGRIAARTDPRGCQQALALLDLATGLPESPPESWTLLALVDAGLPVPVPQFSITNLADEEIYRLDLAWPELRIAIEYDGYEAHEGRQERDEARDADLRRRGWIVIRVGARDLKDPCRMIAAVEAAFRARGMAA